MRLAGHVFTVIKHHEYVSPALWTEYDIQLVPPGFGLTEAHSPRNAKATPSLTRAKFPGDSFSKPILLLTRDRGPSEEINGHLLALKTEVRVYGA